jgi:hypothetical protein
MVGNGGIKMQKWEYCKIARSLHGGYFIDASGMERVNIDTDHFIDILDMLGKEGWELIDPHKDENGFFYFKRPVKEKE